jgi:hypothetical protein
MEAVMRVFGSSRSREGAIMKIEDMLRRRIDHGERQVR